MYMHTEAGLTKDDWQILSKIGQCITSQALPFIIFPRLARRQRAALSPSINGRDAQGTRLFPRGHAERAAGSGLTSTCSLKRNANGPTCAIGSSSLRRRREVCGPSGAVRHRACAVQAPANRGLDMGGQEFRGLLLGHAGAWRRAVCLGAGSME